MPSLYLCQCLAFACLSAMTGCALAPETVQPAAIFELQGNLVEDEGDEGLLDGNVIVALSWYLFKADTLQPVYWSLAAQTSVSLGETRSFTLSLDTEPPADAFVLTGSDRFLDLPAEGNLAIGFITVVPSSSKDGNFTWQGEDATELSCPHETLLVVWWDGPELSSERTGFRDGTLRKGLNLVDLSEDLEYRDAYVLYPAERRIDVTMCAEGMRSPLRSCGLLGERSVETIFLDATTPADDRIQVPEEELLCGPCGLSYRVPDFCTRRFDVLCRDCRSIVVETDPDDPVPDWPCTDVPDRCDEDDEILCNWGVQYRCESNRWVQVATCDDACCDEGCQSVPD